MSPDYNNDILNTCLDQNWISDDQKYSIETILNHNPGLSVIGLLMEQQLINREIADWLEDAMKVKDLENLQAMEASTELPPGFHHINDYLTFAVSEGCSDVHLGPENPPIMRKGGKLVSLYPGAVNFTPHETKYLASTFLTRAQLSTMEENGGCDFCHEIPDLGRFRASVVRQRRGWEIVCRVINTKILSMDQLGLPEILKTLTRYHNGLILVTGAIGSGKSTTLAAMIDHINKERHDHIITLEDPVEYVFTSNRCHISQREIHEHSKSFATALRAALREDPDVIMVGEMRDLETVALAITASETGHLVLGTLHTSTAARTLDRLLDVFPVEQQPQIRTMVSESIRGIICQQLIPRVDGKGRVMAMEIMLNNPAVGALIRDSKTFMLPGVIQTGRRQGMQLMDDSLIALLDKGLISQEEAYFRSENKKIMAQEMARRQK